MRLSFLELLQFFRPGKQPIVSKWRGGENSIFHGSFLWKAFTFEVGIDEAIDGIAKISRGEFRFAGMQIDGGSLPKVTVWSQGTFWSIQARSSPT
jgi:hypothetical protein